MVSGREGGQLSAPGLSRFSLSHTEGCTDTAPGGLTSAPAAATSEARGETCAHVKAIQCQGQGFIKQWQTMILAVFDFTVRVSLTQPQVLYSVKIHF